MVRTSYDPEADALFVWFGSDKQQVRRQQEVASGILLGLDDEGRVIGIEVMDVSERMGRRKAAV